MGFVGLVIANNFAEIIGGICVIIVLGYAFLMLGRKLERKRLRSIGPTQWQAYLDSPKTWLASHK